MRILRPDIPIIKKKKSQEKISLTIKRDTCLKRDSIRPVKMNKSYCSDRAYLELSCHLIVTKIDFVQHEVPSI